MELSPCEEVELKKSANRGGALDRDSNECDVLLVIGYYFLKYYLLDHGIL